MNDPNKLIEKQFLDLDGRWYIKPYDSISFTKLIVNEKTWYTDRYLYMALLRNSQKVTWMRKHFIVPVNIPADTLILRLSLFDIQAQVYLNGEKIADSCFIFNRTVCCFLPASRLIKGHDNILAIRANTMMPKPDNALNKIRDEIITTLKPMINLTGVWKFSPGDHELWKNKEITDSSFKRFQVPMYWDDQGLKTYLGIGWYRRTFEMPKNMNHQQLLFVAGKIDDFGEVYLNGTKIGGRVVPGKNIQNTDWDTYGLYPFNGDLLTKINTVAIRVINNQGKGGIYQGPIGIISMDDYLNFITKKMNIHPNL